MTASAFNRKLRIVLAAAVLGCAIGAAGARAAARLLSTGGCLTDGANFVSANGGCEDTVSGLTYSASAYQMVGHIGGNLNYSAAMSYCGNLVEGGFSDWRAPTITELQGMSRDGGADYLNIASPTFALWSSTKRGNKAYGIVPSTGYVSLSLLGSGFDVVCVR